ncbi:twin-arginine translocation pathway signal [Mycobacterium sp. IS-1742]|nr:twin-arginine translocation pathway signal [Mycobacterium sp. IS-1742]
MHDPPRPSGRGDPRSVSRRRALIYGLCAPALLASGSAMATVSAQRASAADLRMIDFTHRQVPPDQIKAAGFDGALVYVSELRPGADFDFKPVTRGYADALRAAGLRVASCYQYGKPGWPTPSDFTRGYDGGVADARTAMRLHSAAGGPASAPIFFSIDEDIDADTWGSVAVEWLRGINSVLGVDRTGVYGHARVCAWAIDDGVIGRSTAPGHWWAWQTRAWSDGVREPRAVLYQYVIVTASDPGFRLGGTNVDVNEVLAADFGQWDLDRA